MNVVESESRCCGGCIMELYGQQEVRGIIEINRIVGYIVLVYELFVFNGM